MSTDAKPRGLSIVVAAYHAHPFIAECVGSIYASMRKADYPWELLIGVDGCEDTLASARPLADGPNIRAFWFSCRTGHAVVVNSLLRVRLYSRFLRFDADDIMCADSAAICAPKKHTLVTICRPAHYDFELVGGKRVFRVDVHGQPVLAYSVGNILARGNVLAALGGYRAWQCAADSDLLTRARRAGIPVTKSLPSCGIAHWRRRHPDSVTKRPDTGATSAIRAAYCQHIAESTDIYVAPVTSKCSRIHA